MKWTRNKQIKESAHEKKDTQKKRRKNKETEKGERTNKIVGAFTPIAIASTRIVQNKKCPRTKR